MSSVANDYIIQLYFFQVNDYNYFKLNFLAFMQEKMRLLGNRGFNVILLDGISLNNSCKMMVYVYIWNIWD